MEIELAQGTTFRRTWTASLELRGEFRGTGNRSVQRRFVTEKEVLEQQFAGDSDPLLRPRGQIARRRLPNWAFLSQLVQREPGFIASMRNEVLHSHLVLEHEQ